MGPSTPVGVGADGLGHRTQSSSAGAEGGQGVKASTQGAEVSWGGRAGGHRTVGVHPGMGCSQQVWTGQGLPSERPAPCSSLHCCPKEGVWPQEGVGEGSV